MQQWGHAEDYERLKEEKIKKRVRGKSFLHVLEDLLLQSHLAITRLAITRIGYNAVGRGPRISAARGEMGATANNNAVINCHLFSVDILRSSH